MEKQKRSFKTFVWEIFSPGALFWFGVIYLMFACIYYLSQPLFSSFCQLFLSLEKLPRFSYHFLFWFGLIYFYFIYVPCYYVGVFCRAKESTILVLNYLFSDISIIVSIVSIFAGWRLEIEKRVGELGSLPPKEAVKKFREYQIQAEKEGWLNKFIEIVRERSEEFLEEVLENKDKELVKLLEKALGMEGNPQIEFLKSYLEKDFEKLRIYLPKWLEELGRKESWRRAIYDAAAECANELPIDTLWNEWFNSRAGRELLRKSVREKLPPEKQQLLEPIKIPWPREKERPENPNILRWCEAVKLEFNPFGPEYAEEDPLLSKYYVFPDFWDRFLQPYPALVLGPEGSGKSALGLYLAYHLRENYKTFQDKTLAIFIPIIEPDPDALPLSLGEALALRTLELVAYNPFNFIEASSSQKRFLARLWLYFVPSIRAELAANGLEGKLLSSIAEEVEKLGPVAWTSRISLSMLVELLSPLNPLLGEFRPIYLVADLKALPPETYDLILWLEKWVSLVPSLLRAGFYSKILCVNPLSITPQDFARIVGWEWDLFVLDWDEEKLVNIIEQRIKAAGSPSFNHLCQPPLRELAEEMAKAAKGSPRKLIRLGNEILQRAATHLDNPLISKEDLEGILP